MFFPESVYLSEGPFSLILHRKTIREIMNDILERMRAGELILETDPDYPALYRLFEETMSGGRTQYGLPYGRRGAGLLERIWGQPLDASVSWVGEVVKVSTELARISAMMRTETKMAL